MSLRGTRAPIIRRHPLTGEPIEPVGVVNGKVVWPVMGGAPDDDDDDKDDDDVDDDDASDDADDNDDDSNDDDDADKGDTVSRAEFDKIVARMKAADKRADALAAEKKKAEDAKKDDLTKAQDRVTELESENKTLVETVSSLRLNNAFLSANKHKWHDGETALALAKSKGYLEDVTSDDGDVDKKALTKALDKLATEHKYLVDDSKGDDDKGGPSGEPSGDRKKTKDKKARQQQLAGRFPSIR